ncbi:hypothetical protein PMAYCL1PPCAC_21175, partial [Pristionchus mayeri]
CLPHSIPAECLFDDLQQSLSLLQDEIIVLNKGYEECVYTTECFFDNSERKPYIEEAIADHVVFLRSHSKGDRLNRESGEENVDQREDGNL